MSSISNKNIFDYNLFQVSHAKTQKKYKKIGDCYREKRRKIEGFESLYFLMARLKLKKKTRNCAIM